MESNVYSLRKSRPVEVPGASTLSPESEMSGNTPCTRSSSLETALPRINSEPHLPARQDPCYDSLVLSEVGKDTKNIGVGLELSDVQNSKRLASFPDLQQAENCPRAGDSGLPERPFKVSKLLEDRIRVLESEVQKHLTEAKEAIEQARKERKKVRASSSTSAASLGSAKSLQSRKDATKSLRGVQKHSAQKHKGTASNSRLPGKRLSKIKTETYTSEALSGGKLPSAERSAERKYSQTHDHPKVKEEHTKKDNATLDDSTEEQKGKSNVNFKKKMDEKQANEVRKEKHVISMLEITEQTLAENDGGLAMEDKILQNTMKEPVRSPVPKGILKEPKIGATKSNNLTKSMNKTIKQLYQLNKVKDAVNLSDLLQSKIMAEKELKKAIERELQEEMEERKRQEEKYIEKSRREAFCLRMKELERLEEEMREARIHERERRRAEARERREKNILLRNEQEKSILSMKISRAFNFSYFPLLIHDSRNSSSADEQSSSEDSGRSSSDTSASDSRQNSASTNASSSSKRNWNHVIGCSHSRQERK